MNGTELRLMREALGWSQMDLAEKLGKSERTISRWENQLAAPSRASQSKLRIVLSHFFTSNGSHASAYGHAMAPDRVIKKVRHAIDDRLLVYGLDGYVVEFSDGFAKRLPFIRTLKGMPVRPFLPPEGEDILVSQIGIERLNDMFQGTPTMVRSVCASNMMFPGVAKQAYRRQEMTFPSPGFAEVTSIAIDKAEYDAHKGRVDYID